MSIDKQPDFPREALARLAVQILEIAGKYRVNPSSVIEWLSTAVERADRTPESVAPNVTVAAKAWLERQGVAVGQHTGARNMAEYRLAMKTRGGVGR